MSIKAPPLSESRGSRPSKAGCAIDTLPAPPYNRRKFNLFKGNPVTDPKTFLDALQRPGNVAFATSQTELESLQQSLPGLRHTAEDGSEYWHAGEAPSAATTRIKRYPTGHRVFYTQEGKRFLMTDPQGHTLHEVEWQADTASGESRFRHVRMQLDCRQWVGIRPRAKKYTNRINISSMPGWERMTLDDLRKGASQAWRVPYSEVKYFYHDENFVEVGKGEYDVQLFKDGLYVLIEGGWEKTVFISYMFTVNWDRLDLIPVVELFQSTLPGTGGAAFEFIWGLYEDQSREEELPPLRYRGLPTYPSKEAFNIFNAFFEPKGPKSEDILNVFLNPDRSHEIEWTPRANPPWRYFHDQHNVSVTVQDGDLYKVSVVDDAVSVPYINTAKGSGPCQRYLEVMGGSVILHDGADTREIPLDAEWQVTVEDSQPKSPPAHPFGWRHFFSDGLPTIDPVKVLFTVPVYPDGDEEIHEPTLQPMAVDQILHYMEQHDDMPERLEKVQRVLVHTFDTVIAGCIDCTRDREYVVLFSDAEFAQKNAQELWNYAASRNQLENVRRVRFLKEETHVEKAYQEQYDLVYKWVPFFYHTDRDICEKILMSVVQVLAPGGLAFLVAPWPLKGLLDAYGLNVLNADRIVEMPFFQQHLKMCPENQANPDVTVFFVEKK